MTNQYRKKPVVIEAVQYDGDNEFDIKDWAQGVITSPFTYGKNPPKLEVKTLEGTMTANVGDWIIKGIKGKFIPASLTYSRRLMNRLQIVVSWKRKRRFIL